MVHLSVGPTQPILPPTMEPDKEVGVCYTKSHLSTPNHTPRSKRLTAREARGHQDD